MRKFNDNFASVIISKDLKPPLRKLTTLVVINQKKALCFVLTFTDGVSLLD